MQKFLIHLQKQAADWDISFLKKKRERTSQYLSNYYLIQQLVKDRKIANVYTKFGCECWNLKDHKIWKGKSLATTIYDILHHTNCQCVGIKVHRFKRAEFNKESVEPHIHELASPWFCKFVITYHPRIVYIPNIA